MNALSPPLRVLHVRTRNKMFFEATRTAFALPEFENTYLIHCPTEEHAYWKQFGPEVTPVLPTEIGARVRRIPHDILVVHYLSGYSAQAIQNAAPDALVVWSAWGCDYQDLLGNHYRKIVLAKTRELCAQGRRLTPDLLRHEAAAWAGRVLRNHAMRRVMPRVDVMTAVGQDFERLSAMYPRLRADNARVGYYCIEDSFRDAAARRPGSGIQIGNSAFPWLNHVEAFDSVCELWDGAAEIVCPLSYGDDDYADRVEREGRNRFGKRFVSLRQLLPIDEYNHIVGGCGSLIINTVREKAAGNIALAIYQGRCVYLRDENPLLETYQEMGATLFSVQGIPGDPTPLHARLSDAQRDANRDAIGAYFSREALQQRALHLSSLLATKRAA